MVAAVLEAGLSASDGWHITHSVVIAKEGYDIDHVVVGPPGVFVLNTKNHRDKTVWVSGFEYRVSGRRHERIIPRARSHAEIAASHLTAACGFVVRVFSALVIVGSAELIVENEAGGIKVVGYDSLLVWLRSMPSVLSQHDVDIIAAHVRSPSTWLTVLPAQYRHAPPPHRVLVQSSGKPVFRRWLTEIKSLFATTAVRSWDMRSAGQPPSLVRRRIAARADRKLRRTLPDC